MNEIPPVYNPIVGIDPGTTESAIVVISTGKNILYHKKLENEHALVVISNLTHGGDIVEFACEMIASYGMPVGKEVFETCVWIGRFKQIILESECSFSTVYRKDVKLHFCNSAKAKDANIRQALIDRYGAPGTRKNPGYTYGIKGTDEWAALAVATYYRDMREAK